MGVEQAELFSSNLRLPSSAICRADLRPTRILARFLQDCHNYIYANEGLLKERVFNEVSKLLFMKMTDEAAADPHTPLRFHITEAEHATTLTRGRSSFVDRLRVLYDEVRLQHSELLADEGALGLQPATLAFVVARLQWVDLTNSPSDAKGEAFQEFVYSHQRGARGEYFTPLPAVRLAVALLDPQPGEAVIDPACGSGGFIVEALRHIRSIDEKRAHRRASAPVFGIEFNPDVARAAALRLALEGSDSGCVRCGNALSGFHDLAGQFDVVLTNPPFGSKGKIDDPGVLARYQLARKWSQHDGSSLSPSTRVLPAQAPDILFLERSVQLLKPGGRLGIVLPEGLFQNTSSQFVRTWLRANLEIWGVVSLPSETFIPYGTGIKTSVLFAQKAPARRRAYVVMGRITKIGYDVKGKPTLLRDGTGAICNDRVGRPLLDEDVSTVSQTFKSLLEGSDAIENSHVFPVDRDMLGDRIDVDYYRPNDLQLIRALGRTSSRKLKEVAELVRATSDFRRNPTSEIRYVAISNVNSFTMRVDSMQVMKAHDAPTRASFRLQEGDIITAISGASTGTSAQATAIITAAEKDAICSNGFAILRRISGVAVGYLLWFLRSEVFLRQVRRRMTGHAIPAISIDDLGEVLVPIPDESTQNEIDAEVWRFCNLQDELLEQRRSLDLLVARALES